MADLMAYPRDQFSPMLEWRIKTGQGTRRVLVNSCTKSTAHVDFFVNYSATFQHTCTVAENFDVISFGWRLKKLHLSGDLSLGYNTDTVLLLPKKAYLVYADAEGEHIGPFTEFHCPFCDMLIWAVVSEADDLFQKQCDKNLIIIMLETLACDEKYVRARERRRGKILKKASLRREKRKQREKKKASKRRTGFCRSLTSEIYGDEYYDEIYDEDELKACSLHMENMFPEIEKFPESSLSMPHRQKAHSKRKKSHSFGSRNPAVSIHLQNMTGSRFDEYAAKFDKINRSENVFSSRGEEEEEGEVL